ncbi:Crp/Fnr family transcriptional regulator [Tenacibaculum sp. SZ-18]|uniref:Crp/Fnr family transcriptional regulator n=1 Tax=Tenacibaculum sp. SZ-18 TaxID=754423 RepID=UPI000C2D1784|nr:Crp/Fnr family transcriptional regulator [Tenacibaculum sp. SZ-18]AUC13890.1 Crp/Fnr family transcriptional regulator [Tenacibaculum sp. SZ-18]
MVELLYQNYEFLFQKELLEEIKQVGVYKKIQANSTIIDVDSYITSMPLVLNGAIKILREDNDGDELVLYYLEVGDTCAMTLSCCMGQVKSQIRAVAETDVELLMIPKKKMTEWLSKYLSWQEFVLQSYHSRMEEFIKAVDSIAFLKMDERLYKYLQNKVLVNHSEVIQVTHQQIANDLHTSRVVISRLLKGLEKESKIELHRSHITVLNI